MYIYICLFIWVVGSSDCIVPNDKKDNEQ